ncbi:hypothetical protein [Brevibacillus gelatini]|nr:hypothetical protein [Brevibacillus gelatini]
MNKVEIRRFIALLEKWVNNELTWRELREYKYQFSDSIEQYYQEWQS